MWLKIIGCQHWKQPQPIVTNSLLNANQLALSLSDSTHSRLVKYTPLKVKGSTCWLVVGRVSHRPGMLFCCQKARLKGLTVEFSCCLANNLSISHRLISTISFLTEESFHECYKPKLSLICYLIYWILANRSG